MKQTQNKHNEMRRHVGMLAILLVPVVALILGISAPQVWANDDPVCWFNIELNATDLDVGVRGFFDYEPYKELEIEDPNENEIADLELENSLGDQGFAEFFFESGEPELADISFAEFLERFPEGTYEYEAEVIDDDEDEESIGYGEDDMCEDDEVECEAYFTHVIPCAPEIKARGNHIIGYFIRWKPVTQVVDTVATDANVENEIEDALVCKDSEELVIVGYEVIVETEVDGVEKEYKIDLPGNAKWVSIPREFIALSDEFDYEVLAIEESGNQTISEDEFCVGKGPKRRIKECPED
jgi:hypothetical protein